MDRPREPSLSLSLSLSLPPSRSLCPPVSPWLAISFPPSTSVSQSCSTPVRVHSLSTFYYSISLYLGLLHLSFSRPLPFVLSLYSPGVPLHLSLKHLFIPLLRYLLFLYGSLSLSASLLGVQYQNQCPLSVSARYCAQGYSSSFESFSLFLSTV